MPLKIGGGHRLQNYDSSTGRYGCGEKGYTHAYAKSLISYDKYLSDGFDKKTSSAMPNYKSAITSDAKFVDYSLNETHPRGKHKAMVYKKILGFTKENYMLLKEQIHNKITSGKAMLKNMSKNDYGVIEYNYRINVRGPNGKSADIMVKYGIGKKNGKPFMITNYVVTGGKKK